MHGAGMGTVFGAGGFSEYPTARKAPIGGSYDRFRYPWVDNFFYLFS